jgi:hypothetical protein
LFNEDSVVLTWKKRLIPCLAILWRLILIVLFTVLLDILN